MSSIRRAPDSFRFPGGRRVGIVFNIAYEGWSEGQVPGIGPMGNPLKPGFFDANAASWGLYGPTRGIWRALEIAARNGIRTSVMTNGVLAEKWPETVRAIHVAGHEVVAGEPEARRLVHLQSDAVPQAMAVVVAVARVRDRVARDPVDLLRAGARAHRVLG
jgi:hypothetical protein